MAIVGCGAGKWHQQLEAVGAGLVVSGGGSCTGMIKRLRTSKLKGPRRPWDNRMSRKTMSAGSKWAHNPGPDLYGTKITGHAQRARPSNNTDGVARTDNRRRHGRPRRRGCWVAWMANTRMERHRTQLRRVRRELLTSKRRAGKLTRLDTKSEPRNTHKGVIHCTAKYRPVGSDVKQSVQKIWVMGSIYSE